MIHDTHNKSNNNNNNSNTKNNYNNGSQEVKGMFRVFVLIVADDIISSS